MTVSLPPKIRRVVQAVLYERLALAFVTPMLSFNALFERWESKQTVTGRSWRQYPVQALGRLVDFFGQRLEADRDVDEVAQDRLGRVRLAVDNG